MTIGQIETERLTLRPITTDDADLLVALNADPQVMRFINGGRPTPRAEVEDVILRSIGHRWLAFEPSGAAFIGWFGMRASADDPHTRSLGYRLRRDAWGKGYATEGARALIATAFTRLDATRVVAETMAVNTASRRVMERCGMRYLRTFHLEWDDPIAGTEHGEVEYELLKEEWDAAGR